MFASTSRRLVNSAIRSASSSLRSSATIAKPNFTLSSSTPRFASSFSTASSSSSSSAASSSFKSQLNPLLLASLSFATVLTYLLADQQLHLAEAKEAAAVTKKTPTASTSNPAAPATAGEPDFNGLNPKDFEKFKLTEIRPYNHNSQIYVFDLKDPSKPANLPITSFVLTRFTGPDGKPVIRPYTPIDPESKGKLHLLVKEYPTGVMSKHIANLKVGETLDIKGPLPKFPYKLNQFEHIGFVAGGSGLTPCLQLTEAILNNPADHTKISFIFANASTKDILLKEQLDAYARKFPSQFRVVYVIDKKEKDWSGEVGHVNADLLQKFLPKAKEEKSKVFVCGPPAFYGAVSGGKGKDGSQGELGGALQSLGYAPEQVFKF